MLGPDSLTLQFDTLFGQEVFRPVWVSDLPQLRMCPNRNIASHIRQSSISRFSIPGQCQRVPQCPTSGVHAAMCGRGPVPPPPVSFSNCAVLASLPLG